MALMSVKICLCFAKLAQGRILQGNLFLTAKEREE
jgi:hypothetical protein